MHETIVSDDINQYQGDQETRFDGAGFGERPGHKDMFDDLRDIEQIDEAFHPRKRTVAKREGMMYYDY